MKKLFIFILLVMCVSVFTTPKNFVNSIFWGTPVFAQRVPDIHNNRIDLDQVPIDITAGWTNMPKSTIAQSDDEYFKGKMKWVINMDGPSCKATGIVREIKDLPMPEKVQIKVFPVDNFVTFIGFTDSKGNVGLYYPKNIKTMQWNTIDINTSEILPFALNAPKIEDIAKIAFVRDMTGGQKKMNVYFDTIDFI
ncbi:MAG: hypothetical protein KBT47_00700, partial [Armatimonadetes bacterium]|nr:hypothetical protein [Candidatus Hippobium faecium]